MSLKIALSAAAAAAAMVMVATTAVASPTYPPATNVAVGTPDTGSGPFFILTNGSTPFDSSITARFGLDLVNTKVNGKYPLETFNDSFNFTIPQNGIGSGSLSTSFSGMANTLVITGVSIDGVNYDKDLTDGPNGQGLSVGDITIKDLVPNDIDVTGYLAAGAKSGGFDGTATFVASAPEPAAWLLMIGGLGIMGAVLRRRNSVVSFA